MRRIELTVVAMVALLFGFGLSTAPVDAQSSTRVAVLVNDQPITQYAIDQRSRLNRLTRAPQGGSRQAATNELIEEALKLQAARQSSVSVGDDQVNEALGRIAQGTGLGSVSRLRQALGSQGVNLDTLSDRFRADIAWREVVQREFRQNVRIREQDILAAFRAKDDADTTTKSIEADLQQLIVVVPDNAGSGEVNRRKRDAERLRAAISGCGNLRSVASAFRDVTVREIGARNTASMSDEAAKQIEGAALGKAMAPVRRGNGFELTVVCNKREVSGFEAARAPMETEMRNEQGMILSRRLLRDLRADALIEYR
ncbi:MAG: SurA N-terminal domain-containing protein [Pseudomonadota bacterium]